MKKGNYSLIFVFLIAFYSAFPQGSSWELRNGPLEPVRAYAFANNLSGYTIAGDIWNGVFISSDYGSTWLQSNSGLTDTGLVDLLVNVDGKIYAVALYSVFRSDDDGINWVAINTGLSGSLHTCITNDAQGNLYLGGYDGVYKSTNNGQEWFSITSDLPNEYFENIIITPNGDILVGLNNQGIYRSTDDGTTWIESSNGFTSSVPHAFSAGYGGRLFAASGSDLFYSTDNGYNWLSTNIPLDYAFDVISYDHYVIATANGVAVSTDDGNTWSLGNGLIPATYSTLGKNSRGDIIVRSALSGLFVSHDNGFNWKSLTRQLTDDRVTCFLVASDGDYYTSTALSGIFRSSNRGETWQLITLNTHYNSLYEDDDGNIYGGSSEEGLWRTTDKGENWTQLSGFPGPVMNITVDSYGNLYAGLPDSLYRSTDEGMHWTSSAIVASSLLTVGDKIFAGSINNGVYRSTDYGESWMLVSNGMTNPDIIFMACSSTGDLYAVAQSGYTYESGILYRSTDFGDSWVNVYEDEPHAGTMKVLLDSYNAVYIARNFLLLKSTNFGGNWDTLSIGFPTSAIYPSFDSDGHIATAVYSSGIYRTVSQVTSVDEEVSSVPAEFSLEQNFPNPFNPSTKIKYSIPNLSLVRIRVYDILGNEIESLVNEEKAAGNYEITWTAGNLASGVYICRLTAGAYSVSRKMLFIK